MAIRSAVTSTLFIGVCALLAFAAPVAAQDRMDKPVRIIVGFAPGGTADLIARVVADKLKDTVGQPVIVDNRPGAAGRIAADLVKGAAPDGSTIMVMPIGPMAVVPHTLKQIPYDPVKDFTAIGLGATFQFALAAGPGSGAKTWGEFVAWAKANPNKASYATSAAGSLPHFVGVLLSRDIGIEMVHVAYKGSGAYMNDLMGGQVPSAIDTVADLSEQHRAGKIRILATTGTARAPATPDVPTFSELGLKNMVASGWFGFFAPPNTPKAVIDTLNRGINKALASPDVVERLTKLGMDPATSTPDEFAKIVASDYAKWGPIVKASGFTAD
jgi:tripartite-type tricarboxylate transporter receptor subunit TctC